MIGSKLVQIQMKVPDNKIKIFDISINFERYQDGNYVEMESYQKETKHEICSPETMNTMFGILGCGHVSYFSGRGKSDPDWVFAGPSKASLMFQKTDNFQGLIGKYSWSARNVSAARGIINEISFVYDTPGSTIDRKTLLLVKFDESKSFLDVDMIIPALDFKFSIKYDWTHHRKVFSFKVTKQSNEIFEVTQSLIRYRNKFEGVSKVRINSEDIINWRGVMFVKPGTYSLDARLNAQFHEEIVISADTLKGSDGRYKIIGKLNSSALNSQFSIHTRIENHVKTIRADVEYGNNSLKDKLTLSGKFLEKFSGDKFSTSLLVNLDVSSYIFSFIFTK